MPCKLVRFTTVQANWNRKQIATWDSVLRHVYKRDWSTIILSASDPLQARSTNQPNAFVFPRGLTFDSHVQKTAGEVDYDPVS